MSSSLAQICRRRAELVARAEEQRAQLSYYYGQFNGPVILIERATRFVSSLSRSPLAVTGLTVALLKTPWRRLSRWPKLIWRGWSLYRFIRGWAT